MSYDPGGYPPFAVTVDLVVLTLRDGEFAVLLVRRGGPPYQGRWALPGGFVHVDESVGTGAERELAEETGLGADAVHLEQLGTYGAVGRDPRMRVVSVAYLSLGADLPEPVAGTDAAAARWWPVAEAEDLGLAFDHAEILADGVERARAKLEYTSLAAAFCPDEFTVVDLRRVYESVWGVRLDPRNFHRKVTGADGFLVPTGHSTTRAGGRPAQLYRQGQARHLHPPFLRPSTNGS